MFAIPGGVDVDADLGVVGTASIEEGACEPRDLVTGEGDIELSFAVYVFCGIEGCYLEVDGAFLIVEDGVEVELLLSGGDIELDVLLAVDTAQSGAGIEGATTSGVVEAELLHFGGDIVGYHEPAEGDDSVQGDGEGLGVCAYGDGGTIEEGVGISLGIGELYLCGVGHRGIAIAAMGYDYQLVPTFGELEGGCSEFIVAIYLVGLLHLGVFGIIYCEVDVGADAGEV